MSNTPATDWYQDDRPELWDDDSECDVCGGEGVVGWFDHPELHGDDLAEGLEDHLVSCPKCSIVKGCPASAVEENDRG